MRFLRSAIVAFASLPLLALACDGDTTTEAPIADSGAVDTGIAVDGGSDGETPDASPKDAASCFATTPTSNPDGKVTLGVCAPVAACGGALEGVWQYTEACTADPTAQLTSRCPAAVIHKVDSKVAGTLQFACGQVERKASTSTTVDLTFPKSCGLPTLSCAQLAQVIPTQIPNSKATCTDSTTPNACECSVTLTTDLSDKSTYNVVGNQVQTPDKTYDFCVTGTTLAHATDANEDLQGTFSATKL